MLKSFFNRGVRCSKVIHVPNSRKLHVFPWFAGRQARQAYKMLDEKEKALFWKKQGKAALYVTGVTGAVVGSILFWNIEPAPVTGRKRILFFDLQNEILLGKTQAETLSKALEKNILPIAHPYHQKVLKVHQKLVNALPKSPIDQKVAAALNFENLYVIDNLDAANAFVLPDGSTFVFTGLLERECSGVNGEGNLAVILGHEMAHALQRHGGERLSFGGIVSLALAGATFFCTFLGLDVSGGWWRTLYLLHLEERAFSVLTTLPQSRCCEAEADHVGLLITAAACFDPRLGPKLWKEWNSRLVSRAGVDEDLVVLSPPEYLSTHPANERRVKDLIAIVPEALKLRNQACVDVTQALKNAAII
jgi:Zn-dependent protease with chaperone function